MEEANDGEGRRSMAWALIVIGAVLAYACRHAWGDVPYRPRAWEIMRLISIAGLGLIVWGVVLLVR